MTSTLSIEDVRREVKLLVQILSATFFHLQGVVHRDLKLEAHTLNEALRKEVERMKMETGEISTHSDSYDMGMQHIQYSPSTFMAIPQYHGQDMQMQSFNPNHPMDTSNSQSVSEFLQNGRLQGLEISSNSSIYVKFEGPSLSASESSSAY